MNSNYQHSQVCLMGRKLPKICRFVHFFIQQLFPLLMFKLQNGKLEALERGVFDASFTELNYRHVLTVCGIKKSTDIVIAEIYYYLYMKPMSWSLHRLDSARLISITQTHGNKHKFIREVVKSLAYNSIRNEIETSKTLPNICIRNPIFRKPFSY